MESFPEITEDFLSENCVLRTAPVTQSDSTQSPRFECILCKAKRLTEATLLSHVTNLKHFEIVKRRKVGVDKFTDGKYHAACVTYSLESLLKDRCGGDDEFDKRIGVVAELDGIFQDSKEFFPELTEDVSIEMYGSSKYNGALVTSDVNCFLRVKEYGLCVNAVDKIIKQNSDIYDAPTIISSNSYPRIRFNHKATNLEILICVFSSKSENFTSLMICLLGCDTRARDLTRLLKIHCEEMALNDGTFTNHMCVIMAVYFSQQTKPPLLPKLVMEYDHLMTRQEEDKYNKEEKQKRVQAERKAEKTILTTDELSLHNFAGNYVIANLRNCLQRLAFEDKIDMTDSDIEGVIEESGAMGIFPEVTPDNDPWKMGTEPPVDHQSGWDSDQPATPHMGTGPPFDMVQSGWDSDQPATPQKDEVPEKGPDWEGAADEHKIRLSEWGEQYLTAVRQLCYEWTSHNSKDLHSLFQEMLRFYAKFNFDGKVISLCRSEDCNDNNKYGFVEDPFQPMTPLYNIPKSKSKKSKKQGKGRLYHDMTKHVRTVFEILKHYYEAPHKKDLCLSFPRSIQGNVAPFSPFELAIRYAIPEPFSQNFREYKQEKLPPLNQISEYALSCVGKIIDKIVDKFRLSEKLNEDREKTFRELGELVQRHPDLGPRIEPKWFGSSRNGLVLSTSDMDITLDITKMRDSEAKNPVDILNTLAAIMKQSKLFLLEDLITNARVPIIKFRRTDNDLSGDIAVNNLLAIENTKLIKTYTEIDDRVHQLGYLVKKVVKACECADASTGSLSSYAYTMMVIYFLQQVEPPVIPVLQEMEAPRDTAPYLVEAWNTYFYKDINRKNGDWPCSNTDSVSLLVLKFFKFYYEDFDYNETVIAPKQKSLLSCKEKNWYRPINIEDPFNLDHNLGKQVNPKTLDIIKTVFKQAYLRYSVGPLDTKKDPGLKYYLDKNYLLDGKQPPVCFVCFGCGSRDHYIYDCPNKNLCGNCNSPDHQKNECPKVVCFNCRGFGHMSGSCPLKKQNLRNQHGHRGEHYRNNDHHQGYQPNNQGYQPNNQGYQPNNRGYQPNNRYPNSPHKGNKRISPDKQHHEESWRKHGESMQNWLTNSMRTPDVQISKKTPDMPPPRTRGVSESRVENMRRGPGSRSVSESSETPSSSDTQSKKKQKKKRTSSEGIVSEEKPRSLFGAGTPKPSFPKWSDPVLDPKVPVIKKSNILRITTADHEPSKPLPRQPVQEKIEPSTTIQFMGGAVTTPIPSQAKENSRQKQSKSKVRQDMFGEMKPKASSVSHNKKQSVKTSAKVPSVPGSGRKATKAEIWEDPNPGVKTEGSRYGPKKDVDEFSELAPDFFQQPTRAINNPDPNNLDEWGDLTVSMDADPVMGAVIMKEQTSDWIGYLSSSPEKPALKPPPSSTYQHYPTSPASQHLLNTLHSNKGGDHSNKGGDHSNKGGDHSNKGGDRGRKAKQHDPYLRRDTYPSEDYRERNRQRSDNNRRDSPRKSRQNSGSRDHDYRDPRSGHGYRDERDHRDPRSGYRGDEPRPGYRGDEPRPGHGYRGDEPRPGHGYRGDAPGPGHGYRDDSRPGLHGRDPYRYNPDPYEDPRYQGQQRALRQGGAGEIRQGQQHYREEPRSNSFQNTPNSFMSLAQGYQPQYSDHNINNRPNFDVLKMRPGGKGRGCRPRPR